MSISAERLSEILERSSRPHNHLCPRQVLGARVGLAGGAALGMDVPRHDKNLLIIAETDGCFLSGLQAATGCAPNRRTLRVEDYGKIAASFVNIETGEALRVAPKADVRARAFDYAPGIKKRYYAMLTGYQTMPDEELLSIEEINLKQPVETIVSRAGVRVDCALCGEEIINERELIKQGEPLCLACAGRGYYTVLVAKRETDSS